MTPWSGGYSDYREVDGLLLPHRVVVSWHIDGRVIPYARFVVESFEIDVPPSHLDHLIH